MWDGEGVKELGEDEEMRGNAGTDGSRSAAAKARAIYRDETDLESTEKVVESEDGVATAHQPTQEYYNSSCVWRWVGG